MKLFAVIGVTSLSHALAQTTDAFSSIFPDSGSTGVPDVGTVGSQATQALGPVSSTSTSASSSVRTSVRASTTIVSPAPTTTQPSVSSSTVSPSGSLSLSLSGTLLIETASSDAPSFAVASSSPTTTPAAATSTGGDRVAVIALSSILGALLVILIIVGLVLLQRRKHGQAGREGSTLPRHGPFVASARRRLRPSSWISSLRRSGRVSPSDPRHQFAAATSQPLMSEGSPVYGFHPPQRGLDHAGRPVVLGDSSASAQLLNNGARHDLDDHRDPITSFTPTAAVTHRSQQPRPDPTHSLPHRDAGNQYVDAPTYPTGLGDSASRTRKGKDNVLATSSGVPPREALASHPVGSAASATLSAVPGTIRNAKGAQAERKPSIPGERFADAIAGFGIGSSSTEDAARQEQSTTAEPAQSVSDDHPTNDDRPLRKTPSPPKKLIAAHSRRRTHVPRLTIPTSLVPGRKFSKRTRFSVPGHDDISPTTESWQGADEAGRGHGRRPSTVSPVSSEPGMHRVPSHTYPYPRAQYSKGSVIDRPSHQDQQAATLGSRHVESDQTLVSPPRQLGVTAPRANRADQSGDQAQPKQQRPAPSQSYQSTEGIKRKPVPYDLATLVRKPLPPHPVPTSKYNQAARKSTKPQGSQTQDPPVADNRTHGDGGAKVVSSHPQPTSTVPAVASVTVYDQMVRGMSGMQTDQQRADTNNAQILPQIQEFRPQTRTADPNPIGSGYPQTAPRNQSAQRGPGQQSAQPSGRTNRNTVEFFDDPNNREYAQVYGSYYSQSSPADFKSPTSPQYPVSATSAQSRFQAQQSRESRDRPPTGQLSLFPRGQTQPIQQPELSHEMPRAGPARSVPEPSAPDLRHESQYPELTTQFPWRDSRQDAWRDSLSRSGSDHASNSVNDNSSGRGATVSSAGGARTGLWGSPGFFGVEPKPS